MQQLIIRLKKSDNRAKRDINRGEEGTSVYLTPKEARLPLPTSVQVGGLLSASQQVRLVIQLVRELY